MATRLTIYSEVALNAV